MNSKNKVIGIDTSNYKTSVSVVDFNGNVISDEREFLKVKQGERGLRQSDALFQHVENLPHLLERALDTVDKNEICAVSVSSRPRPVEGSYMPCFNAGLSMGKSFGSLLKVPVYEFSHQEGHLEAVINNTSFSDYDTFITYHLSGGTCEMLKVTKADPGYEIEIIGGSKDISYGQVLDRAGVAMGLTFPCGQALDMIANTTTEKSKLLKPITVDDTFINLSGIDTQFRRALERDDIDKIEASLINELFYRITESIVKITNNAYKSTGINKFVFAGGVSGSSFVRKFISEAFSHSDIEILFGTPDLSQDNAVGTALLGVKKYGIETR